MVVIYIVLRHITADLKVYRLFCLCIIITKGSKSAGQDLFYKIRIQYVKEMCALIVKSSKIDIYHI